MAVVETIADLVGRTGTQRSMHVHCYTLSRGGQTPIDPAFLAGAVESLPALFPGLSMLETGFPVPGRGELAGLALDPAGRCTLIEVSPTTVGGIADAVCRRLDWFSDNLGLLHRLFPGRPCAPLAPRVAIVAPDFEAGFERLAASLDAIHAFRVRPLRSSTEDALLIEPVGARADAVGWLRPPVPAAPHGDAPTTTFPLHAEPTSSAAAYRPKHAAPDALRDRALQWLAKLSPDIASAPASGRTDETTVTYREQPLATLRVTTGHLHIDVPSAGRFQARDSHELNRAIQHVIARFFKLVEPRSSVTRVLRREDILTDGELAELQ